MNTPAATLTPAEVHHRLENGTPFTLLDVMGEDCFADGHIEGAVRACVYETAFLEQVRGLHPDPEAIIVVYGTGAPSLSASVAAGKLREAGYTRVHELQGGLATWRSLGYAVTGGTGKPEKPPLSGTFTLDTEKSLVRWTGRNLLNHHEGTVNFRSGHIAVKDGALDHAEFTVDMGTIKNQDLTDPSWNAMLIRHLVDADFFHVKQWPDASFVMRSAMPIPDATPGLPNFDITGDFTLRGQTHPIAFQAVIGESDGVLAGQAEFDLDRTRWGAIYGSGKFFDRLAGHLVNDLIHLHLKILATRSAD